jgi:hypothetical protein
MTIFKGRLKCKFEQLADHFLTIPSLANFKGHGRQKMPKNMKNTWSGAKTTKHWFIWQPKPPKLAVTSATASTGLRVHAFHARV